MKMTLNIISVILILGGLVFFLQGINILPGTFMTGDPQWVVNGGSMIAIGIGFMLWGHRRK